MQRLLLVFTVFAACALGLSIATAQERLTLNTPIAAPPAVQGYTISSLLLKWEPTPQIVITLRGEDGKQIDAVYEGAIATTLITALNKANLTTRSLNQRIFDRLIADGKLAGTVGGTVQ